jgi:hypothetical protein
MGSNSTGGRPTQFTVRLLAKLRALAVGESVFVPGKTTAHTDHIRAKAMIGTDKFFASSTRTTGVRITRLE